MLNISQVLKSAEGGEDVDYLPGSLYGMGQGSEGLGPINAVAKTLERGSERWEKNYLSVECKN